MNLYEQRYEEAVKDLGRAFTIRFGIADAEAEIAQPLIDLLRMYLPNNRAPITAAISTAALMAVQLQWPTLGARMRTILARRPSPRLVVGSLGILRRTITALEDAPEGADTGRIAWFVQLVSTIQRTLDHVLRSRHERVGA